MGDHSIRILDRHPKAIAPTLMLFMIVSVILLFAKAAAQNAISESHAPSPGPAATPGNPTADQNEALPKITVTGYIVPHIGNGPQPVTTLDQDFIRKQGDQTVADVLQRIPENFASFTPALNAGESTAEGGSSVNLYGLGANSTLVLINGRRQAAYPFAQFGTQNFVDLNSIPLAAVDRIEILKDGASAIYGSDAVAGVVNILLKDEYQGADLRFYYGISQRNDYSVYRASAVSGFVDKISDTSKFSVVATFEYYEQGPIMQGDRSYSRNLQHSQFGSYYDQALTDGTAGYFGDAAGNTYTVIPGTRGPNIIKNDFVVNGPPNPLLSVNDVQLIPREQRYGGYLNLKYEPTNWLRFYQEFMDQRNEEKNEFYGSQPTQADAITIPANNPYNPFGVALQPLGQTLSEVGPQKQDATVDTVRTVTGLLLFLPKSWFVDLSFLYSESDGDAVGSNEVSVSKLNAALAGTLPGFVGQFYNPFVDQGVVNNPNGRLADGIRISQYQKVRSSLLTWALRAGGELVDLPGGPVTLGVGAEYRSDDYISSVDRYTATFDVVGGGAAISGGGKRYVKSGYAELSIPIVGQRWSWPGARSLQIILAERYDDYSDFGSAAKPKFALLYKPLDDLTLRATYSEGFRAPSLSELYSGTSYAFQDLVDPQNPSLGEASYEVRTSGNPNLQAETSYEYFADAVWSPGSTDPEGSWWGWANGFTANLAWFQIEKRNQITLLNAQQILNQESVFPGLVARLPDGSIKYVDDPFVNLGAVLVDGISFGASYQTKEYHWGKLDLEVDLTYIYNYAVQQINQGSALISGFGTIKLQTSPVLPEDDSYTLPDLKLVANLFYTKTLFGIDRFRTGFTLNYIDSEHDVLDNYKGVLSGASVQPNGLVHRIGSFTTLDWQISYEFGKGEEITPETPRSGYSKEGKRLVAEAAISSEPERLSVGIGRWLAGASVTFGINNLCDTAPPFADNFQGYDAQTANPLGRYFYFELGKKF